MQSARLPATGGGEHFLTIDSKILLGFAGLRLVGSIELHLGLALVILLSTVRKSVEPMVDSKSRAEYAL